MKRLRPELTYANVVSTICLFLLLGGGAAFAASQLGKNSVGTKQLRNGAVTYEKIAKSASARLAGATGPPGAIGPQGATGPQGVAGAPATKLFAQVKEDGTINASSPGVTSSRSVSYTGIYYVNFHQDITHCAAIATQGAVPDFSKPGANTGRTVGHAVVDVSSAGGTPHPSGDPNADTVLVETYNASSTAANTPFYIAVFC